jgi:hypothetical protein
MRTWSPFIDIVEDVLKQLMQMKFTRENADCGIERDFLDRCHQVQSTSGSRGNMTIVPPR